MPVLIPAIAAIAAEYAAGVAVISTMSALAISAAASVASLVMGEMSAKAAQARARDAYNASLKDQTFMVRGGVTPSAIIYGRTKVSGPILFVQSNPPNDQNFWMIVGLCRHPIDAVEQVWFDNRLLTIDGSTGFVTGYYDPLTGAWTSSYTTTTSRGAANDSVPVTSGAHALTQVPDSNGATVTCQYIPAGRSTPKEGQFIAGTDYSLSGGSITFTSGGLSKFPSIQGNASVAYRYVQTTGSLAWVGIHLGDPNQAADGAFVTYCAPNWTTNHRLRGCAYLAIRLIYNQNAFPSGIPNVSVVVRGRQVYDPRTGLTKWSNNAALCLRDYLCNFGLPISQANVDDNFTIAAANSCDEQVQINTTAASSSGLTLTVSNDAQGLNWAITRTAGSNITDGFKVGQQMYLAGTGLNAANLGPWLITQAPTALVLTVQPMPGVTPVAQGPLGSCTQSVSLYQTRYTCDGILDSGTDRATNVQSIVSCMAGAAYYSQGLWRIRAGANVTATLTLNEDNLATGAVQIVPSLSRRDIINNCRGKFMDIAQGYAETDFPVWSSSAFITQDGGINYPLDMSFPMTTDSIRAQRLAKIAVLASRYAYQIKAVCNLSMYQASVGDGVAVSLARYGISAQTFRIIAREFNDKMQIVLTLKQDVVGTFAWNMGEQAVLPASPSQLLPNPGTMATPTISTVVTGASVAITRPDGTVISCIVVTLAACTQPAILASGRVELQWFTATAGDWQSLGLKDPSTLVFVIENVSPGITYTVRVRYLNSAGAPTDWVYATALVAAGSGATVPTPTGLAVVETGPMRRITWNMPTIPADLDSFEIRYQAGSSFAWASGTTIAVVAASSVCIPNSTQYLYTTTDPTPAGTYSFGIQAIASDGRTSSTDAALNYTLDAGGSLWATSILGQLADSQVAALAASKITGQLSDSQLAAISASKIGGQLTDAQIAALSATKVTGQLTDSQLAAISASKLLGGSSGSSANMVPANWQFANALDGWALCEGSGTPMTGIIGGQTALILPSGSGIGVGSRAFQVIQGETYVVRCRVFAYAGYTSGIIGLEILEDTSYPSNGYVSVVGGTRVTWQTPIWVNGSSVTPLGSWVQFEAQYTPTAGTNWVSLGAYNWNTPNAQVAYTNVEFARVINAASIKANEITAGQIAAGTITAAQIAAGTITATQIAAGTITANLLAAGSVTTSKLAVVPQSICPDPTIQDWAYWSGAGNSGAWFQETNGGPSGPYGPQAVGTQKCASMWGGNFNGTAAQYLIATPIPFSTIGQVMRLRARMNNTSNWTAAACARCLAWDQSTIIQDSDVYASPGSGCQDYSTQFTVPSGTCFIQFWIGGLGGAAFTGMVNVSDVTCVVAASADLFVDGTITGAKLVAGTITATEIAAGTITAAQIAAGTIDASKLNVGTLSAISGNLGTISAGTINAVTVNAMTINGMTLNGTTGSTIQTGMAAINQFTEAIGVNWSGSVALLATAYQTITSTSNINAADGNTKIIGNGVIVFQITGGTGGNSLTIKVYRDGLTTLASTQAGGAAPAGTTITVAAPFSFSDVPDGGAHYYTFTAEMSNNLGSATATQVVGCLLAAKR